MHHQRKDLWLKWASELIFSLHWFNPLMGCFRKELNRCCELSCDEAVLRQCTTEQRKDYGLTLLELAAIGCAPQTTLATGFSQPKKDLKERLVELMNWKPKGIAALLAAAALLVSLCACGSLLGPAKQGSKTDFPTAGNEQDQLDHPEFWAAMETASKNIERPDDDSYLVDTVDEFLMALGSDRTIVLDPGTYLLSDSSAYSINSDAMPFRWQEVNDGFQLVIDGLDNLTIQGADRETTELLTAPRGAHTLNFRNCDDLSISGLTIGHTTAPSECMGSVIAVENVENGTIDDCVLFGCGTWAVNALASSSLTVQNSDLTDCSAGAVYAVSCNEVTVDHCRVFDNIKMPDVHPLFDFFTSRNCVVSNCDIRDNAKLYAVSAYNCDSVYFLGNQLDGNQFTNSVFSVDQPIIVEGCSFGDISKGQFFSETYPALVYYAIAQTGRSLTETELSSMKHQTVLGVPYQEETPELTFSDKKPVGDTTAVDVSTVDEFLAAIGDNRTIYLAEGVYDLTQAQGYGTTWGDHYQWVRCSDGYELVIQGVENLHLIGNGQDNTQLFGNASSGGLSISYCEDLSISNLCLGDREGSKGRQSPPLSLQNSRNLTISQCRLSGGTFGLSGFMLQNMTMERTTIDDCSDPAIYLNFCQDILINDCTIPEFPAPYNLYRSENVRLNGETISSP